MSTNVSKVEAELKQIRAELKDKATKANQLLDEIFSLRLRADYLLEYLDQITVTNESKESTREEK
jgi:regulator of replication initiation timing